jgi:16S rRNA (guanine527-N7)-methyltransferase
MPDSIVLIDKYFPELNKQQQQDFAQLGELYAEWNAKINVISRKDMDHFYERHVLHSLGIAKVISFTPGTQILDVGTGGGFPGIPLAILFPECEFYLVDSIKKKIKVVNAVIQDLGLRNVKAEAIRAEQVHGKFDFVVSRAVTRIKPFLQWVSKKIDPDQKNELKNGILYLKGGDLSEEMAEIRRKYLIYELSDYFEQEFFQTKKVVHVVL